MQKAIEIKENQQSAFKHLVSPRLNEIILLAAILKWNQNHKPATRNKTNGMWLSKHNQKKNNWIKLLDLNRCAQAIVQQQVSLSVEW